MHGLFTGMFAYKSTINIPLIRLNVKTSDFEFRLIHRHSIWTVRSKFRHDALGNPAPHTPTVA